MLAELRANLKNGRRTEDERVRLLKHALDKIKTALDRLYDDVEGGHLPQDGACRTVSASIRRDARNILLEMGALRRRAELPLKTIEARQVDAFARILRGKLLGSKSFAKQYLRTLVTEIRVSGEQLSLTDINAALAQAVAQT